MIPESVTLVSANVVPTPTIVVAGANGKSPTGFTVTICPILISSTNVGLVKKVIELVLIPQVPILPAINVSAISSK